jgi:peptidoglycan/LPS O-acetylase OafA/YrhL
VAAESEASLSAQSAHEGPAASARLIPPDGRIIAIDIVRGFAILWVILYHLWTDVKYTDAKSVSDQFRVVPHKIAAGEPINAATAFFDAFLRVGYLGVALFMILSGLSLTLVAMRRDMRPASVPTFLYRRLRRVMIPYWFGFVFTIAFAAVLAIVQWQRNGGHGYAWFLANGDVNINAPQLLAGALLVPRFWKEDWRFAPEGSLWFVLLILQYYLLFPLLFPLMKRIGPWFFLALSLAVTLISLNWIVAVDGSLNNATSWTESLAPFRIFEFGLGMTAGYLMTTRPQLLLEYTRAPLDVLSIVVLGLLLFVGGSMIEADRGDLITFQTPMQALGMALIVLPLIVKIPGRLELSAPGRIFAWVGAISYTVLIVNEPLRSVTHTMRAEGAADAWLVLWIGVIYMPVTLLVARPLAVFLGLVQRGPPAGAAVPAVAAASTASAAAPGAAAPGGHRPT